MRYYLLISITLLYSAICISQDKYAIKGVLDLTSRDWNKDGIADLSGEWAFYWNTLYDPSKPGEKSPSHGTYIDVPDFWNSYVPDAGFFKPAFGFATYRIMVICPPGVKNLDLKFLTVASNFKLFVNDAQLTEIGKVGRVKKEARPDYRPVTIPVTPIDNKLDIVIQVSNFNYSAGGLWDYIKLGPHPQIQTYQIQKIAVDFFIAGSFFLIAIFYLVVFIYFPKRKAALYFSLFCLILAMRPLVTGEMGILYITNWNWRVIKHVEFIGLFLTVPVLSLFTYELFPKEFPKKILRLILLASLPFVLLGIFATPFIFRYALRPFQVEMLLAGIFGIYVYTMAVKRKRPGSVYFLTGVVILFITIINDILYNSLIIQSVNLIYAGLFILIISQAIALSRQFFWTFSKLEILNNQLRLMNEELSQKNLDIVEVNDQLKKVNAELDILVSRTSHDLRSPLTSVVALVHIIKKETNEGKRHEYLEMQRRTLHRLNVLITDILDFARNKRTDLLYEPADFLELVNSALQDHQFSDNSSHIQRITEVKQDFIFITDVSRINMILYNLISNALKYHDKQKEYSFIKVDINVSEYEARIEVSDNGSGIAPQNVEHIFSMFYQADKSFKGSGLGLYILHEAVQKLGGNVVLESALGEGTKFIVVIPNHIPALLDID